MSLSAGRVAIAICDVCNFKFPYTELRADGNSPGLRVCKADWNPKDPWRLPPIQPDAIALKYPRPDTPLVVGPPIANGIPFWDGDDIFWDDGYTEWLS